MADHPLQGRTEVHGIPIAIENRRGSVRSGVDPDGHPWRIKMRHHYGYIERTMGEDGEEVDVFIGPTPSSRAAFIVHQRKPDGTFDEWKVMLGFPDREAARRGYLSNYDRDDLGADDITETSVDALKLMYGFRVRPIELAAKSTFVCEVGYRDRTLSVWWPVTFAKAEPGFGETTSTGERWITVHPHGDDAPGVPVKIRIDPHTGHGRVIAGAGGKLQHLRLTNLRSPEEHERRRKARAEERKAQAQKQRVEDAKRAKEAGVQPQSIAAKKAKADQDLYQTQRDHIGRVAKFMGWDESVTQLDPKKLEALPPQQQQRALAQHHQMLVRKADEAVSKIRKGLTESATARAEAALGTKDPTEAAEAMRLTDFTPEPTGRPGAGYAPETSARLREAHKDVVSHVHGLDADKLRQATADLVHDFRTNQVLPGEKVEDHPAARRRGEEAHERLSKEVSRRLESGDLYGARKVVADAIIDQHVIRPQKNARAAEKIAKSDAPELAAMHREMMLEGAAERRRLNEFVRGVAHPEEIRTNPTSFAGAMELLAETRKSKVAEKKAREAKGGATQAAIADKTGKGAFQTRIRDLTDDDAREQVERDIEGQLRENLARSFLRATEGGLEEGLGSPPEERQAHLAAAAGIGAHQALAQASLVFAQHGGLAREAVDVLGIAPAAQLAAAHLRATLGEEGRQEALEALAAFHKEEVKADSETSIKEATDLYEKARALAIPEHVENGDELLHAMEASTRKRQMLREAREALGLSLGKFEAVAALQFALSQPKDAPVQVTMPNTPQDTMLRQLYALGLKDEHFKWRHDGQNGHVELAPGAHVALMTQTPDAAARQRQTLMRDIKGGAKDEKGWLPPNFVKRPKESFEKHGQALPDLSRPFQMPTAGGSLEEALIEHVGSRVANGEPVWKILPTLNDASQGPLADAIRAGRSAEYGRALDKLAPTHLGRDEEQLRDLHQQHADHVAAEPDASHPDRQAWETRHRELQRDIRRAGGMRAGPAEWQGAFDDAADRFLKQHHPGADPIHRQKLGDPEKGIEALHRTLAPNPGLKAAFKGTGDMTEPERDALRAWFMKDVVKAGSAASAGKAQELRRQLEEHDKKRPEEFTQGLFGPERTPEHVEWSARRKGMADELAQHSKAGDEATWADYAAMVGGSARALETAAEFARGHLAEQFAHHYEAIHGEKIRTSRRKIAHDDLHDLATDPEARAEYRAWAGQAGGELRRGAGGRYGSSPIKERLAKAQSEAERREINQGLLLGAAAPAAGPKVKHARVTLGDGMERQLAGLVDSHFGNMDPKMGKVDVIPGASMDGKYIDQQRIIKAALEAGKMAIGAGVGNGKTGITIGTFDAGHTAGKYRRGLFSVPTKVLGQFHEQATQWLRPGAYRYKQLGGASKAERMATYRDPETHMVMVSHDTMRDDMRDMVAAAHGWSPAEARERILAADDAEVDKMLSTALQKHGAEKLLDYYSIDEGHMTLNRQGKPDSLLAKISDSLLRQSKGGNIMSGTLAKNDETEVFDILHKLDPQRWKDMGDFNRRFPKGSNVSRDALRRTIDSYIYASAIDPGTKPVRMTRKLDLHPMQKARMAEIDQAHDSIAEAHRALRLGIGNADEHRQKLRESAQKLWPPAFTKTSPDEHDRVAQGIAEALPTMRRQAYNDAIHGAPVEGNAKFQAALETAEMYQRNDPGEIFDHLVKHGAKTEADRDEFMRDAEQSQHKGKPAPGVFFLRSIAGGAKLAAALQAKGLRVQHFKGSLTPGQKAQAQRDFRDGKFDVMVASDAAADGLNLQRGRYLAQLDTPDTYRVYEQRNGRINRLGQKEREPHIYDFVADHPHEVRERERLQSKKGLHSVIHDVSESIDDTGLAHHLHRVREEKKARHGDPYYPMPAEVGAA